MPIWSSFATITACTTRSKHPRAGPSASRSSRTTSGPDRPFDVMVTWRASEAEKMTLFEYVTVAVSIVLSFGVVRLLDGLRAAALPECRYWVHLAWIPTKLLNHALYWWGLWSLRDAASWNFAMFLWVLLFPATLYLQSTALVTTRPDAVSSWRDHFFGIRIWFFSINLFLILHTIISSSLLLGVPFLHLSRLPFVVMLILNVLGVTSDNPRLHAVIAAFALLSQILGFGLVLFRPGSLSVA